MVSHQFSRRRFGALALGVAGAAHLPACAAVKPRNLSALGIQLYTVRDAFAADPAAAIKMIADAGFNSVELGGPQYLKLPSKNMKRILSDNGMIAPAMHIGLKLLQTDLARLISYAHSVGVQYLVLSSLPPAMRNSHGYAQAAQTANDAAKDIVSAGLNFAYHNHAFEFEDFDGETGFDILTDRFDPDYIDLELDVHWAVRAGQNPVAMLEKYAGRIRLCHLKDINVAKDNFALPGQGIIDFSSFIKAADATGMKHYFFEHDRLDPLAYPADILEAYNYLMKVKF